MTDPAYNNRSPVKATIPRHSSILAWWIATLATPWMQNRYLASFLLEKAGPCIALARQSRPDVILLDIQLPVMDGYSVASVLRQIPSLHDTAIIAVTSFAMVGDREKALASGCNSYIEKPINTETFVTEIENLSLLSHSPQQAV